MKAHLMEYSISCEMHFLTQPALPETKKLIIGFGVCTPLPVQRRFNAAANQSASPGKSLERKSKHFLLIWPKSPGLLCAPRKKRHTTVNWQDLALPAWPGRGRKEPGGAQRSSSPPSSSQLFRGQTPRDKQEAVVPTLGQG